MYASATALMHITRIDIAVVSTSANIPPKKSLKISP